MRYATFTLALLAASSTNTSARTWYIMPDGTGDAPTIQAGVDSAAAGDVILLASGTFVGASNKDVTFKGKDLVITSESGATSTIIDCEGAGRGFFLYQAETSASVISNLTIRNGNPTTVFRFGGAIACLAASPTVVDCVFADNVGGGSVGGGGGAVFSTNAHASFESCTFIGNSVDSEDGFGGAMSIYHSSATITDCTFRSNSFSHPSGGVGGGIVVWTTSVVEIEGCTVEDNADWGAALLVAIPSVSSCLFAENPQGGLLVNSNALLTDCTFVDNSGDPFAWGAQLGGSSEVVRCLFGGNGNGLAMSGGISDIRECIFDGDRVLVDGAETAFSSCTFYQALLRIGADQFSDAHASVSQSILAFAPGAPVECFTTGGGLATATLSCTDVFGNAGGDWVGCIAGQGNINSNFSADPLLCDPANDDFTIHSKSPCAPPGVTGCGLVGALPVGCGPVFVQPETWAGIKSKYR